MKACCWCKHLICEGRKYRFTTGQRNVSGGIVWYEILSPHRCILGQEDRYPRNCDYEEDTERFDKVYQKFGIKRYTGGTRY